MTPFNCMPDIHAMPNGTPITVEPGCGLICHNCGARYPVTTPMLGYLANHDTYLSGRVRYVVFDQPAQCSCGYYLRGWDLPCGGGPEELFVKARKYSNREAE